MTYKELLDNATAKLTAANVPDAKTDAWRLFESFTGMSRAEYFMNGAREPGEKEVTAFTEAVSKRAERIPLQYITGTQEFYGRTFKVSGATLIPRFDTEVLVDETVKLAKDYCRTGGIESKDLSILDICTGTGCIVISLAEELGAGTCVGTDVSSEAISLAKYNADSLGRNDIRFFTGDLYEALNEGGCIDRLFDIIVSNPPYIKTEDIAGLSPEVRDHEPLTALDGSADGLLFYRRICEDAHEHIKPGGLLIFEIGADEADDVSEIMKLSGFRDIRIFKDLAGLDRVAAGTYGGRDV